MIFDNLYGVIVVTIIAALYVRHKLTRPKLPYPPGPKGSFLIGNLRDIPKSHEWITYTQWARDFNSDVIHLDILGAHLLIVNTAEAAFELFEKRFALYNDRPYLPMLVDLAGWDWSFGVMHFGPKWRFHRKLFHRHFNGSVVPTYEPHQRKACHELLYRLEQDPDDFMEHIRLMAVSLILNIGYSIDIQSREHHLVTLIEYAMETVALAGSPGSFLVDSLPILKRVPDWFPGAKFKRLAKEWRVSIQASADVPLQYVKDEMAKGTHVPSIASRSLEALGENPDPEEEEAVRGVTASIYAAGSDTLVSTLCSFVLAMVLNPAVFQKAQAEIDRVVGQDRLPDFGDTESLPYLAAVIKEVLRWNPVTPLALGHRLMADDIYNGQFMPGGSFVLGNSWAILHDEKTYPDPFAFNPERFLKNGQLDPTVKAPESASFGFGRRACAGKHFALSTLFINCASMIATFNIKKAVDEHGNEVTPSGKYKSGFLTHPEPFKCSIKPRSERSLGLINEAYAVHHS